MVSLHREAQDGVHTREAIETRADSKLVGLIRWSILMQEHNGKSEGNFSRDSPYARNANPVDHWDVDHETPQSQQRSAVEGLVDLRTSFPDLEIIQVQLGKRAAGASSHKHPWCHRLLRLKLTHPTRERRLILKRTSRTAEGNIPPCREENESRNNDP